MINVGEVIGWAVEEQEELEGFKVDSEAPKKEKKKSQPAKKVKKLPDHELVKMPALSPTMEQGKVIEWKVKEGDEVQTGDSLALIETDKSSLDFEIQDSGFIAKILVKKGSDSIRVGEPLLILVQDKEDVAQFKDYVH